MGEPMSDAERPTNAELQNCVDHALRDSPEHRFAVALLAARERIAVLVDDLERFKREHFAVVEEREKMAQRIAELEAGIPRAECPNSKHPSWTSADDCRCPCHEENRDG